MDKLHFEWDDAKAKANLGKHGIGFDEACSAFADESAMLIADPDHSESEDRFILLGLSMRLRLLVVCHCCRSGQGNIRIISARKATARESETIKGDTMRKEYDFSKAKKNPYALRLKKQVTIRLDEEVIDYFKSISGDVGIPYQSLVNLYLRDCVTSRRELKLDWR